MWATHVGLCKPALHLIYSSSWDTCSTDVQHQGCTFHDLFTQVLQYGHWSWYNMYDWTQQRYREAIEALQHLCNNIEPGE